MKASSAASPLSARLRGLLKARAARCIWVILPLLAHPARSLPLILFADSLQPRAGRACASCSYRLNASGGTFRLSSGVLAAENGHLMCAYPWEVPWEVRRTAGTRAHCFEAVCARVATAGGGGVAAPASAGSP